METERKMLHDIHKNADMGQDTLRHILEATRDPEFSGVIRRQKEGYEEAFRKSGEMLRARYGEEGKEAPFMGKLMAHRNISRKSVQGEATSKLAEMVMQGGMMGVTELTRQIHAYAGEDKEVLEFARKQVQREEKNIEELKKFL